MSEARFHGVFPYLVSGIIRSEAFCRHIQIVVHQWHVLGRFARRARGG